MDLHLTFANGSLSGDGIDDVARFFIKGRYDAGDRECYWTKTYPASHDVFYRGFRDGKGIWGRWEISNQCRGGFHIWPCASTEGEAAAQSARQVEPVDAIESELSLPVAGRGCHP